MRMNTRRGQIRLPAYIPVTTFGDRYPLDDLVRPYLPRLADGVMVSYHYACQMDESERLDLPLLLDSGGYALIRLDAKVTEKRGLGQLVISRDEGPETIHPREVIDLQERIADVGFTLDFPIPPDVSKREAKKRRTLSVENARWALQNRRRHDLLLFASIQGWSPATYRASAEALSNEEFDGYGIGGLLAGGRSTGFARQVTEAVRDEIDDRALHVFGVGTPEVAEMLFEAGATSVDSSSYVQAAAQGRLWGRDESLQDPSVTDRVHVALCNLARATKVPVPLATTEVLRRKLG